MNSKNITYGGSPIGKKNNSRGIATTPITMGSSIDEISMSRTIRKEIFYKTDFF